MYLVYLDKNLIHDLDSEDNVLVSPTLELELNKAGTFTFSMECTHPYYDKLERFKSIVQVLCDGDEIFKGRIIEITDDMYKARTVYCESELAYLNDTIQRPYEYHLAASAVYEYLQAVIGSHNSQVDDSRQFELGEITVNDPNDYIYCYTNYNSTMDEIKEDLVDDLGGYIRIRNEYRNNDPLGTLTGRYIDYIELEEYGRTSEQYIQFGENLLDFSNDINQADICTGIIPLGATLDESQYAAIEERVTIESVNEGSDYIVIPEAVEKYGLILKVVTWDDITEPSNLLAAAQNYLGSYEYEPQTITATAVDMHLTDEEIESWRLGDKIFVESEPHDLHKRFPLAQMSIPLDQPENTSVTLGTYEDISLSGRTNRTEQGLRNFEDFQIGNVIASAVAQATSIIDMKTNGYVTLHYDEERDCVDELLIMDTPDTSTATRVWRWNLNGLGYSSTGYSGDDAAYGTAITMNGWILGSFIIANGMILADDNDIAFGKFDDTGMKIYAQSGREDLLLMRVGLGGMEVYNDDTGTTTNVLTRTGSTTVRTSGFSYITLFTPAGNQTVGTIYSYSSTSTGDPEGDDYGLTVDVESDGSLRATILPMGLTEEITVTVTVQFSVRTVTVDPWLMTQIDGDGFRNYDQAGTVRSNMDYNSFDIYDANGTLRSNMTSDSYNLYHTNGNAAMSAGSGALTLHHTNGKIGLLLSMTSGIYYQDDDENYLFTVTRSGLSYYGDNQVLNYAIRENGSLYYNDGNLIGMIGVATLYSYPNEHGLVFNLSNNDEYMSFAHLDNASDPYYTIKFAYYSSSCSYPEGVAFGDDARMNNYNLYLGTDSSSGYFHAYTNGGGFDGGDFWFSGNVYSNNVRLTTMADTVSVMLTANGEESEGTLSFYSGMKLDVSDLVDYKSSDETLKTSIQPINDARVDNITPVTFKWKSGDNTAHYGYIAQEVREAIPEIVKENDDGLLSLAYTEIIPLLHAKINTLEDRIAKLEEIIYGKEKI